MATDRPPDARAAPGSVRRTVRAQAAARYPTERIWGIQLAGAFPISGTRAQSQCERVRDDPLAII